MDIKTVTYINSSPWLMILYSNSYSSVNQYITIMIEVVYIVDAWKQWKKSRMTLYRNRWCLRRLGCGLFVFYYLMYLFNFSLVDSWACKNSTTYKSPLYFWKERRIHDICKCSFLDWLSSDVIIWPAQFSGTRKNKKT